MATEVITFRKDVLANSSLKMIERIKDYGLIEEIRVRFYPGVERSLQIIPYVMKRAGKKDYFFTVPEGTEEYITGDNDYFIFPVGLAVALDEEVVVHVKNVDLNYSYTAVVDIVISYRGEIV